MTARRFRILALISSLLVTSLACGQVSVNVLTETPAPSEAPAAVPTEVNTQTPPATSAPSPTIPATPTGNPPGVPDFLSTGTAGMFATPSLGFLVVEAGKVQIDASPVDFGLFWDYSPDSGRLAYASEFFHGSNIETGEGISISDLWVYDYHTGGSQRWLADGVAKAAWAPGGEVITAAVYNPDTEHLDMVLVLGPNEVQTINQCGSPIFSWSPDGDRLAIVATISAAGITQECAGTYIASFPGGMGAPAEVSRISDLGTERFLNSGPDDRPYWAEAQNALIVPETPFWIVPLDGSPPYVPAVPAGEDAINLPRPSQSLWDPEGSRLIGYEEVGMSGKGGVWVFRLSSDLGRIEEYYRIGDTPADENSFISLVGWWQPGKSILVLDGNPNQEPLINDFWSGTAVWSLDQRTWVDQGD